MVVLIDDDDTFRSALADQLRDDGHSVLEFTSPVQVPALDTLGRVGVVITDYNMPDGDGLMFADRFHAVYPKVPIVLVTASPAHRLLPHLNIRDYVHILPKPLNYSELRELITRLGWPRTD